MEEDHGQPIVSISLGCKAVFLLGGPSREDPPVAMMMRSGDVILMAGYARSCFHGTFVLRLVSALYDSGLHCTALHDTGLCRAVCRSCASALCIPGCLHSTTLLPYFSLRGPSVDHSRLCSATGPCSSLK